jgi:hypothetical protein
MVRSVLRAVQPVIDGSRELPRLHERTLFTCAGRTALLLGWWTASVLVELVFLVRWMQRSVRAPLQR